MNRRRFLAAVGTAASTGLAGCGYAYGGGDDRGSASVHPGGLGRDPMYALGASGIAAARSGRITIFNGPEEGVEFTDGTELHRATRGGGERWRHTYRTESDAVALGDVVYLLDVEGRVVAFTGQEHEDEDGRTRVETTQSWGTMVPGARPPLSAAGPVAFVATDAGVAAVRDGAVQWRTSLPTVPANLLPTGWGLLASGGGNVVALDATGDRRWRADGAAVTATADRVYRRTPIGRLVAHARGGRRLWAVEPPGTVSWGGVAAGAVVVGGGTHVTAYAADGTRRWQTAGVDVGRVGVPAPEGAYVVATHEVVGVGPGGRRWARPVEETGATAVAGWLDDASVAFLFESGRIRWFQRVDQSRGLFGR